MEAIRDWTSITPKSEDAGLLEDVGLGEDTNFLRAFILELSVEEFLSTRITKRGLQLTAADWKEVLKYLLRNNPVGFEHLRSFAETNYLVPMHMIPTA